MNKVFLIGRLTHEPEFKKVGKTGTEFCRFSIAVDRTFKSNNGDVTADFFTINTWGKLALNCASYLIKGRQCAVVGRIENRTYEKDGVKRTISEIIADNVEFIGGNNNNANTAQSEPKTEQTKISDLPLVENDEDLPF